MDKPHRNSQQLSTILMDKPHRDSQQLSEILMDKPHKDSSTIQEALIAIHPEKMLQINNLRVASISNI